MGWSDRDIRRLLRTTRVPGRLERDPVGRALRDALGAATALDALTTIAHRALRPFPPVYWAIVSEIDFAGTSGNAFLQGSEHGRGLSPRSLYRYRAVAIAAIRTEVERATRRHAPTADALVASGARLWESGGDGTLEQARACFEQAVALDPASIDARTGLAMTYLFLGQALLEGVARSNAPAQATITQ